MSDPPGMKRSHDDPTSPHPKRHNTEQSNIPHPSSSKDLKLQLFRLTLQDSVGLSDPSERLDGIYSDVEKVLRPIKREQRASFVSKDVFKTNVSHDEAFEKVVRKAAEEGASEEDLQAVVAHKVFWTNRSPPCRFERSVPRVLPALQNDAIEKSWTTEFIGDSSIEDLNIGKPPRPGGPIEGLKQHIMTQLQAEQQSPEPYGRYCSIIQSSGMGKSRLLDQFSTKYFMIPINLRDPTAQGYPPPDNTVRNFLTRGISPREEIEPILLHFFIELFLKTAETLKSMGTTDPGKLIQEFRRHMSEGQRMESVGDDRLKFYQGVVDNTDAKIRRQSKTPEPQDVINALDQLRGILNSDKKHRISREKKHDTGFVDVFITFDEAHALSECFDENPKESRFVALRRVLSRIPKSPLFSFFLSTTGKITQFGQSRGRDPSTRIYGGKLATPRPYIYLGFDQLMQNHKLFAPVPSMKILTLGEVTSMEFAANLGRPLWGTRYKHGGRPVRESLLGFAIEKLLCRAAPINELEPREIYAILSQRLALDINTPQYLFNDAGLLDAIETTHSQVENHLRVCVAVGDEIESLRAVAPSEPILSEAAAHIMMQKQFKLPNALSEVLTGFNINQGERGELLVASFFAWARDQVSIATPPFTQLCNYFLVKDLFANLFTAEKFKIMEGDPPSLCHLPSSCDTSSHRDPRTRRFGDVFTKAWMHFNHVIKPQEQKLLARRYLLLFMARGAAALGANCQPGFDAVYPYLYDSIDLKVENVGFVIVQVKNDSNQSRSDADWFRNMDPFKCGLLNDADKVKGVFPIPIIRIVFTLANDAPTLTRKTYESPSDGATSLGNDGQPLFTSYDYVCSGIGPTVLQPVKESESPKAWEALANRVDPWSSFYNRASAPDVLRSQFPGCRTDKGHFTSWVDESFFP